MSLISCLISENESLTTVSADSFASGKNWLLGCWGCHSLHPLDLLLWAAAPLPAELPPRTSGPILQQGATGWSISQGIVWCRVPRILGAGRKPLKPR